ncbi:MAG: DUF3237 domain-containing protein [Chloroflexota bacterium]|nr:DUF3237 domain-containing protein [Chloroflexota bacterium]
MIAFPSIDYPTIPTSGVRLEYLFTCRAGFRLTHDAVGATPDGLHLSFNLTGGEVTGPHLNGTLRAIGSDWLTVRPDGTGVLDLRIAIETDDDCLIYAPYQGTLDHGPYGHDRALRGTLLTKRTPFQIAPRFQTTDPGYQWLNRLRCIGLGQVFAERAEARCAFYAIH